MAVAFTELRDAIDRLVSNPAVRDLYRDWLAAAPTGDLPPFQFFDPAHRPTIAGNLMVLQPDAQAFRYAFYGSEIAATAGFDMTDRLSSEFDNEIGRFIEDKYREVLASGRPMYTVHHTNVAGHPVLSWERLILPVRAGDGGAWIVCYNMPLDRKDAMFDTLLDASMDGIVVLQPIRGRAGTIDDFRYVVVNERAGAILGRTSDQLIGRPVSIAFPQSIDRLEIYREVMASGIARQFEIDGSLDGADRVFRISAGRADDKLLVTISDISALRRLTQRLEQQQADLQHANETLKKQAANLIELAEGSERARAAALSAERFVTELMEAVPVPLFHWNMDGTLARANRHYAAVYGHSPESIIGKQPEDLLPPEFSNLIREQNRRLINGTESSQVYEGNVTPPGRGARRFVVHRALMRDPLDRPIGITGAMLDLTDEYELRKQLESQASTDPLTGLYNRRVILERTEEEIARYRRYGQATALILLDLDHFKIVNDRFGHDVGDQVLVGLAEVLKATVRDGIDVPARFGGEEFVILLPGTDGSGGVALAERLRRRFAGRAFETPQGTQRFTASFGVTALFGDDDSTRMLKRADEALYQAKEGGRNRITLA